MSEQIFETWVDVLSRDMTSDYKEDFENHAWVFFWCMNVGNFIFLICFGFLMFGVHGDRQNHCYFYPMIVKEWVSAGFTILIASIFWIGWFISMAVNQDYLPKHRWW